MTPVQRSAVTAVLETYGLVKLAIRRETSELIKGVTRAAPGFHWDKTKQTLPEALRGVSKVDGSEIGRIFGERGPAGRDIAKHRTLSATPALTPLALAEHQIDTQRSFSGRHGARAGEVLIPGAANAEWVHNPGRASADYLFRGNPVALKEHPDAVLMSRHPDVATGYALGRASRGQETPANSSVHVYDAHQMRNTHDQMADANTNYDAYPGAPEEFRRKSTGMMGVRQYQHEAKRRPALVDDFLSRKGRLVPTYETVVPNPITQPRAMGEYRARLSRTPDGNPAYALSHVSGLAPEVAFRDHLIPRPLRQ